CAACDDSLSGYIF
nr:immunoglobulin light chain junction region [Macaca mulatta]MPO03360.1 immunoglobulin light chain junction region [Macaca mulatta]MPO05819.1 immunoglobulin light chain junction region [Macaca mulatta]MPO09849.1 immunoglobulin light chain junction region [Macaca mulatta]MPO11030.1 immunoglobulin light chain junction region [Macaca mulatta]